MKIPTFGVQKSGDDNPQNRPPRVHEKILCMSRSVPWLPRPWEYIISKNVPYIDEQGEATCNNYSVRDFY